MRKSKLFFLLFIFLFFSKPEYAQDNRIWATYFGGSSQEYAWSVATDPWGYIYIAGHTNSSSNIAYNGYQDTIAGSLDAFLVKYDSLGNRIWSTYFGGEGDDLATSLGTDSAGNVFLAGYTNSNSGIALSGFQNSFGGGMYDAFLVKFDSAGNRLWSTYFGGAGNENNQPGCTNNSIVIDNSNNVYLTGNTYSSGLGFAGFQNSYLGGENAFLVKFDPAGNRIWSTYYGGGGYTEGKGLCVDALDNLYLSGWTNNSSGIASSGYDNTYNGGNDAFLVKFDSSGNRLWSTYYGGSNFDISNCVKIDPFGDIYIAGYTSSTSGIAAGGFQNTYGGGYQDAFLVKFDSTGNLIWATYYGGLTHDYAFNLACDSIGNIFLAGDTYSSTGIAAGGFQNNLIGIENEFIVKFDSSGNRFCATYFGQSHDEDGHIAIDNKGNLYLSGGTSSMSGISFNGFQNTIGGAIDAYLVKFSLCSIPLNVSESPTNSTALIYPNPTNQTATIEFNNPTKQNFTLTLYDLRGQIVRTINNITADKVEIERQNLASGLYFFQLRTDRQVMATGKLTIE